MNGDAHINSGMIVIILVESNINLKTVLKCVENLEMRSENCQISEMEALWSASQKYADIPKSVPYNAKSWNVSSNLAL